MPLRHTLAALISGASMVLLSAAPALADWGFRQRGSITNAYFNGYKNGAFDRRFFHRRGAVFHKQGFYKGNPYRFRRNRGLNGTEAALIGAGIGVLGLAVLNQSRAQRAPNPIFVQQPVVLGQQPVVLPQQPVVVTQPAVVPPPVQFQTAGTQAQCLQRREYQTTVIIAGAPREAYGTACLQPDGSWLQGPVTAFP
ncbi:MAG: hypothetical protein AAGA36_02645 [Pseudomonadota bacterium]